MEIEYWENADGNGKEVFEFTFNAYADINMQTVTGTGRAVRVRDDALRTGAGRRLHPEVLRQPTHVLGDHGRLGHLRLRPSTTTAPAWASTEEVEFGDHMFLAIGGTRSTLRSNGRDVHHNGAILQLCQSVINFFPVLFTNAAGFTNDDNWYDTQVHVHEYTMKDFYNEVLNVAAHTNTGYGSAVLNLVELGQYMSIYRFNEDGQQEEVTDHDVNDVYFAVKVTRHYEGFRRASESNFGQLLGDQFFTTVDSDNYYNDYSSTAVLPTLTGADFDYYEASEMGGYIAVIKPEVLEDMKAGGVREVVVDLNVNDSYFGGNTQLIGVATSSFGGLKLKALRITLYQDVAETKPFYVFESDTFESVTGLAIEDIKLSSAGRFDSDVQLVSNRFPVQLYQSEEVAA